MTPRLRAGEGTYLRVGHRGAAALAPENSLAALEAALDQDVDLVEFDVLESAGELLLAHSERELAPGGPSLDEALSFLAPRLGDRTGIDVDLKWWGFEERVVDAIRRHGLVERTLVSSFFGRSLREISRLEPGLATGLSYPHDRHGLSERRLVPERVLVGSLAAMRRVLPFRIGRMLRRAGADAAMLHYLVVSHELVERCHALGHAVFAWTVNDAETVELVLGAGVDGVISDDPRVLRDLPPSPSIPTIRAP